MNENDLRRVYVPIGTHTEAAWSSLGGGVLLIDLPLAWLVTAASVLDRAQDRPVTVFLSVGDQTIVVDLAAAHASTGLSWIRHPTLDLAACLFPLRPEWGIKGFTEAQCASADVLVPPAPTCALGAPPQPNASRPAPIVVGGMLSDARENGLLLTTTPLLPMSAGAPLVLTPGLGNPPQLAGILTQTVLLPDTDPRIPPLRLAEAVSVQEALKLIRSEDGKAQRTTALSAPSETA